MEKNRFGRTHKVSKNILQLRFSGYAGVQQGTCQSHHVHAVVAPQFVLKTIMELINFI